MRHVQRVSFHTNPPQHRHHGHRYHAIYPLCEDFLKAVDHHEDPQCSMSDAEVITTALVATSYFDGLFEKARSMLKQPTYIPTMLSKSQFNRRLHRLAPRLEQFFYVLGQAWLSQSPETVYLLDSFPIAVCDNIRISRSRLYPLKATEGTFRGYIASKRRYFYGLKVHLLTTSAGRPVEVLLTPGSFADVRALSSFRLDLPAGSRGSMATRRSITTRSRTNWPRRPRSSSCRFGARIRSGLWGRVWRLCSTMRGRPSRRPVA